MAEIEKRSLLDPRFALKCAAHYKLKEIIKNILAFQRSLEFLQDWIQPGTLYIV